jgi:hypothetical protein
MRDWHEVIIAGPMSDRSMNVTVDKTEVLASRQSDFPDALPLQRPGADILNEAIPAFFIGRNRSDFWVARDADGKSGGLFWSREAALRYARRICPDGCATIFPQSRFELDIDNDGDPLISWLEAARKWFVGPARSRSRLRK